MAFCFLLFFAHLPPSIISFEQTCLFAPANKLRVRRESFNYDREFNESQHKKENGRKCKYKAIIKKKREKERARDRESTRESCLTVYVVVSFFLVPFQDPDASTSNSKVSFDEESHNQD